MDLRSMTEIHLHKNIRYVVSGHRVVDARGDGRVPDAVRRRPWKPRLPKAVVPKAHHLMLRQISAESSYHTKRRRFRYIRQYNVSECMKNPEPRSNVFMRAVRRALRRGLAVGPRRDAMLALNVV